MFIIAQITLSAGSVIPNVLREGLCNNNQRVAALAACHNINNLYSFIDTFRLFWKKLKVSFPRYLHQTIHWGCINTYAQEFSSGDQHAYISSDIIRRDIQTQIFR
jgi:hypothetical protein